MSLVIRGHQVELSDAIKTRIADRFDEIAEKYFGRSINNSVTISKSGGDFHAQTSSHVGQNIEMQAEATAGDAYAAFDAAAEKLAKRLRRHKRKLRDDHGKQDDGVIPAATIVLAAPSDEDEEAAADDAPLVVAESQGDIREMSVSFAVMQLDLTEAPFLLFKNSAHGRINLLHRRADGNIGWVDPQV